MEPFMFLDQQKYSHLEWADPQRIFFFKTIGLFLRT